MAAFDAPQSVAVGSAQLARQCLSRSSSTESFNTTNGSRSPLVRRIGKLSLQPMSGASMQLAKVANRRLKKLFCGLDTSCGSQEDNVPLLDASKPHTPLLEPPDSVMTQSVGGLLRKSYSTSTVDALNVEVEHRRHQDRPSSIQLRSSSAVVRPRCFDVASAEGQLVAPKPSPATPEADTHRLVTVDVEDGVRYVTAFVADDFLAPPEPVGSLIKAIYGIVKNPPLCDSESRTKTIKLRLRVTIHPGDARAASPDSPKTCSSSTRAVAERGHRWSSRPNGRNRTYPPYSARPVRAAAKPGRNPHGRAPSHHRPVHTRPAWPDDATPVSPRHTQFPLGDAPRHVTLTKECRHKTAHLARPGLDRIQHVLDWLHKSENDFGAGWNDAPLQPHRLHEADKRNDAGTHTMGKAEKCVRRADANDGRAAARC